MSKRILCSANKVWPGTEESGRPESKEDSEATNKIYEIIRRKWRLLIYTCRLDWWIELLHATTASSFTCGFRRGYQAFGTNRLWLEDVIKWSVAHKCKYTASTGQSYENHFLFGCEGICSSMTTEKLGFSAATCVFARGLYEFKGQWTVRGFWLRQFFFYCKYCIRILRVKLTFF